MIAPLRQEEGAEESREDHPRVSVILAAYESERTLRTCIDSLERNLEELPEGDVEVLVPYRESHDRTLEILRSYPSFRLLRPEQSGIASAFNCGVRNARGRFAVFLNSDDEWGDGFLKTILQLMENAGSDHHVVYTSVLFIDSAGRPLYFRHPAPYVGIIQRHYAIILHPNAIYPTELLKKHPFQVCPGDPPTDRQQVYALMKDATWSRTRATHYRFRVWNSSTTVTRARSSKETSAHDRRLIQLIGRAYVQCFESDRLRRLFSGRFGVRSYWRDPE